MGKKGKSYYYKPSSGDTKKEMLEDIIDKLEEIGELLNKVYDDSPSESIHSEVAEIAETVRFISNILLGEDEDDSGSLLRNISGLCDNTADMYTVGDINDKVDELAKDIVRVEGKLDLIMAALEVEYVEPIPPEDPPQEVVLSYTGPGSGVTGNEEGIDG